MTTKDEDMTAQEMTTADTPPPAISAAPISVGTGLIAALAEETGFGRAPAAGWQRLGHLTSFDLAPVMTQRPLQLLGAPVLPRTSLPTVSSVNGRIGLWLQDSPAFLQLLQLVCGARFIASAAPVQAPVPETTAALTYQRLSLGSAELSAALISAYHPTGQADIFTGLRATALQLILAPAAPPLATISLIGRRHRLLDGADRPVLPDPPAGPAAVPPARLLVRVDGRLVPFPVQLHLNLSFAPVRPHYSLGQIHPDRIATGLPRATVSLSFWLSDRQSLSWAEASSPTELGLTLRLGPSAWLSIDMPKARVLASRHSHRGASEAVLSQVDFELGAGFSVLLARPTAKQTAPKDKSPEQKEAT